MKESNTLAVNEIFIGTKEQCMKESNTLAVNAVFFKGKFYSVHKGSA